VVVDGVPEPTGRWTQLVLQWGGSINESVAVVQRVCAAAGPPGYWRRGLVGHLFARLDEYRWNGRRNIQHLELIGDRMSADPMYWPGSRPDQVARGNDNDEIILRALARGPMAKAKLERVTGLSAAALSTRLLAMKKVGKVISDLLISDGCDWSGVIAKLFAKSMRPTRKAGWWRALRGRIERILG
jgi:hypothetical protein